MNLAAANASRSARTNFEAMFFAMLAILCAVSGFFVIRAAGEAGIHYSVQINEGWNAFHAKAAMEGGELYPNPPSFIYNNYPPLSYYLVGAAGKLAGDYIVAGRLISVASLLLIGWTMVQSARQIGARTREALWGTTIFSTIILIDYGYVGMNDPQLLGHALSMLGLVVLLIPKRSVAMIAVAALCFALGFFTKQSLIALPLASFAWLSLYDRRNALWLGLFGILFLAAGSVLFQLWFGVTLWSRIHSPRIYIFRNGLRGTAGWLELSGVQVAASLALIRWLYADKSFVFCIIYLVTSLGVATWFAGGGAVYGNVFFDALIALGLTAAVGINRLSAREPSTASVYAACQFVPVLLGLIYLTATDRIPSKYWLRPNAPARVHALKDVALIESQPGHVMCWYLALCYWAHKSAEVDGVNTAQAMLTGQRKPEELAHLFDTGYFDLVQLNAPPARAFLNDEIGAAILKHYRLDHGDESGDFYVRR